MYIRPIVVDADSTLARPAYRAVGKGNGGVPMVKGNGGVPMVKCNGGVPMVKCNFYVA